MSILDEADELRARIKEGDEALRDYAVGARLRAAIYGTLEAYGPGRWRPVDEVISEIFRRADGPRLSTEDEALRVMGDGQALVRMREIR